MNDSMPILAGRLRRLAATAIDAVLVPSLTIFLVMVAGVVEDAEDYQSNAWMLWVLLLAIASYLLLNGYWLFRRGQTVGKRALGIAIVASGATSLQPAPWWRLILIRGWFFALLFAIVVPWLLLLPLFDHLLIFGKQRRCLHDYLAGTKVVRVL